MRFHSHKEYRFVFVVTYCQETCTCSSNIFLKNVFQMRFPSICGLTIWHNKFEIYILDGMQIIRE